jgi:hypothetical protein
VATPFVLRLPPSVDRVAVGLEHLNFGAAENAANRTTVSLRDAELALQVSTVKAC